MSAVAGANAAVFMQPQTVYIPCSFEAEFQGQSVWIYGTSLRRRAVRDEASAPRRRQLSGMVPRGATPHTDGAVRPSRSISQSKEHHLLEVHLPLCSFANSCGVQH